MKKFVLTLMICCIVFMPLIAAAQTNPCTMAGVKADPDKSTTLPKCINQIYKWSLGTGALLALLMTVLGGYFYMTAQGNAEQAAKGQEYIWGAIIGLALLFAAYLILRTVNPELVNFRLGNPACVINNAKDSTKTDPASCKAAGGAWDLFYIDKPAATPLPGS